MYNYDKLLNKLNEKNISKSDLTTILGISSRTIAKISRGEKIRDNVLSNIAKYLKCNVSDLYTEESSNKLLNILREEKESNIKGRIYHELQVRMTYNSNHIEGSKLTEEETRMIFEANTLISNNEINVDDIIETSNHFRAIDYIIDIAECELSEDIIKHIHYLLKRNTSFEKKDWFNVGDYKLLSNEVGGMETTKPKDVESKMKKLLNKYNNKKEITFNDIVNFHYEFETIHPFQDGNGRCGRLIALKECLKNNIIPFIIEDSKKNYYYRGLKNYKTEKGYLIDTCLDGQDTFKKLLEYFDIEI